jgi:putative phosphoribosyl transferase
MGYIADGEPLFRDRLDAGRQLAARLAAYRGWSPVVFAIPRGGVPVGAEIARGLGGALDVVVARKLGAPLYAELAIGAVAADGERFLNQDVLRQLRVSDAYLARVTKEQSEEARRREQRFRGGLLPVEVKGRIALLVDDGLATGATLRAAARSLRRRAPDRLIVAAPVGSREGCAALREDADEVVCLAEPDPFYAIGLYYENFEQVEDAEVLRLLGQHREPRSHRA